MLRILAAAALFVLVAGCAAPRAATNTPDTIAPGALAHFAWSSLADATVARDEVSGAAVGDVVYVVGGFTGDGAGSKLVAAYDAKTNKWSDAPDYPIPINHAGVASDGKSLFVFGGWSALAAPGLNNPLPAATNLAFRLDPGSPTWTPLAPMPSGRAAHAAAFLDGKIYIAGGFAADTSLAPTVDVYDISANSWSSAP
ncbi:MAG: Kelch repeat-containing protein, partial [Thermoplasmatota archaeon]